MVGEVMQDRITGTVLMCFTGEWAKQPAGPVARSRSFRRTISMPAGTTRHPTAIPDAITLSSRA